MNLKPLAKERFLLFPQKMDLFSYLFVCPSPFPFAMLDRHGPTCDDCCAAAICAATAAGYPPAP